jgi:5-methylcytosine-specific restriction endonuclease McrA
VLHLSEPEAALRIRVARVSRKHPVVLTILRDGRIHLSGIALLAPLLTRANRDSLLRRATHKSKRQIEEMVAELVPRPDIEAAMRRLPVRRHEAAGPATVSPRVGAPGTPAGRGAPEARTEVAAEQRPDAARPVTRWHEEAYGHERRPGPVAPTDAGPDLQDRSESILRARPAHPVTVEPLAPGRYSVRFTASAQLREKLERLQVLMRHSVPDGDLAAIIDVAVTKELERLEARRFAKTQAPRKDLVQTDTTPKSRHIPAAVRRTVERRDGGRCTYRDRHGRRCTGRHDLEFHHLRPFGQGGSHSPDNLALVCPAHNALMAEQDYGKLKMERLRRSANARKSGPRADALEPKLPRGP